jgi:hypothetical protein
VNAKSKSALAERKRRISSRIDPRQVPSGVELPSDYGRRRFEVTTRGNVTPFGGVALAAQLIDGLGLREEINGSLSLLRRHRPYTEGDHVLSLALASFCGARALDDLDVLREDEAFLDAVGMQRMPDPTTAGDFLRRFAEEDVGHLMEAINRVRRRCWTSLSKKQKDLATIDVDGTLVNTFGEHKEGTDFNFKGGFGYAPLLVSLANTKEPLYIRNQPGSRPSNDGFVTEVEAAIETVLAGGFKRVRVRGDRAYAVTRHFDGWSQRGIDFVFSMTTHAQLDQLLDALPDAAWKPLEREERGAKGRRRRARSKNVKRQCVRDRGYRSLRLETEHFTEITHRPRKCKRDYRLIVVRKTITVTEGQLELENEERYFGYITNVPSKRLSARDVVAESNARCDQENLIEQMKNDVAALTAPVGCLVSNWAWMVIAALPLSFKAWLSMLHPDKNARHQLRRMQYRRFLRTIVLVPVRVVKQARGLALKILGHASNGALLIEGLSKLRRLSSATAE